MVIPPRTLLNNFSIVPSAAAITGVPFGGHDVDRVMTSPRGPRRVEGVAELVRLDAHDRHARGPTGATCTCSATTTGGAFCGLAPSRPGRCARPAAPAAGTTP